MARGEHVDRESSDSEGKVGVESTISNWDRLGDCDPQGLLLSLLNTDHEQIEVVTAILDAQLVSNVVRKEKEKERKSQGQNASAGEVETTPPGTPSGMAGESLADNPTAPFSTQLRPGQELLSIPSPQQLTSEVYGKATSTGGRLVTTKVCPHPPESIFVSNELVVSNDDSGELAMHALYDEAQGHQSISADMSNGEVSKVVVEEGGEDGCVCVCGLWIR